MNTAFIVEIFPAVLAALPVTLSLAALAGIAGWALGFVFALVRSRKRGVLQALCAVLVSFFRGVPTVVLLYIAYFILPQLLPSVGTRVSAFTYALIALGLNQAAYASENFRAALAAVPVGQYEAAYSVNMTKAQCLLRIVLPQALLIALPNMGNMFLGLVQETSLAFYVGVAEITSVTHFLADSGLNFLEGYVVLTLIYEVLSFAIGKGFAAFERKIGAYRWRPAAECARQAGKARHGQGKAE
jgi:His/Glu/Gln/Arg/opine family amino acid ABC transporter permease subunit